MVYKKIGNKIPSLSSLLLAGVLLGSSCPSKKDKDGAAAEQASNENPNEGSQVLVDSTGKVLDKDYLGVVKDIFTFLMSDVTMIDRLSNKPYQVNEADFQGKYAKDNLERLCSSFSNPPHSQIYPVSLQKCFSNLAGIKFRAAGSTTGMQHKFAVGTALKHIIDFWADLHNIHKEAIALINKGAPEVEMGQLLNRLDTWFNEKVKSDKTVFKPEHKFYDSKKSKLLDGDQLVRFLTDKTGKGTDKDKNKKYSMPELLKKSAQEVWINVWAKADNACKNTASDLDKRGTGIQKNWQVKGGSAKDLEINSFPNCQSQKINHKLESNGELTASADSDLFGPTLVEVTFGQFLTTLFNGKGNLDFIQLSGLEGDLNRDPSFDIKGDDQAFQRVVNLANKGTDAFADGLGHHISNTELKEMFPIPDVSGILNTLMGDIEGNVVNKGSSGQEAQQQYTGSAAITVGHIVEDSPAHKLLNNFVEKMLNLTVSGLTDAFNKCTQCIGTDYNKYNQSDMPIDSKISIEVIKHLLEETKDSIMLDTESGSVNKLKETIKSIIIKHAQKAVVYKEGDKYKPGVSNNIRKWISDMNAKLVQKHSGASVTYKQIKDQAASFDINEVVKAMESDYNAVKGVITAKVSSFVQGPSLVNNEDYKTYFPNLLLTATHVEYVNKMKSGYLNKSKSKAGAPAA